MIGWFIAIGFFFGMTAGLYLRLPASAFGFAVGIATFVILGALKGLGTWEIGLQALALAMTLQVSYVIGLVAQALLPNASQRRRQAPEARKVD